VVGGWPPTPVTARSDRQNEAGDGEAAAGLGVAAPTNRLRWRRRAGRRPDRRRLARRRRPTATRQSRLRRKVAAGGGESEPNAAERKLPTYVLLIGSSG
jgi:hypothetical protein